MAHRIEITGAGSGLGEAVARQFADREGVMHDLIGGRREGELQRVAELTGADTFTVGDLFQPGSQPYNTMMRTRATVVVHCAAINVDSLRDQREEAERLANLQTGFLTGFIDTLKSKPTGSGRLFVAVNSIAAFFAREIKRAREGSPYAVMKMQQADIIAAARDSLRTAGVEVVVVHPGAIRTAMIQDLGEDDKVLRTANAFGSRLKGVPGRPNGLNQDRVFEPHEVAEPIAKLVMHYLANGNVPPELREWIMVNADDLQAEFELSASS